MPKIVMIFVIPRIGAKSNHELRSGGCGAERAAVFPDARDHPAEHNWNTNTVSSVRRYLLDSSSSFGEQAFRIDCSRTQIKWKSFDWNSSLPAGIDASSRPVRGSSTVVSTAVISFADRFRFPFLFCVSICVSICVSDSLCFSLADETLASPGCMESNSQRKPRF